MNIEEIKKRANTTALNQAAWTANYRGDVQYLLSLIEQAEEALSYIAYSENITAMNATAEEALQAIRKGD